MIDKALLWAALGAFFSIVAVTGWNIATQALERTRERLVLDPPPICRVATWTEGHRQSCQG